VEEFGAWWRSAVGKALASFCTAVHPLYTRFPKRFGASLSLKRQRVSRSAAGKAARGQDKREAEQLSRLDQLKVRKGVHLSCNPPYTPPEEKQRKRKRLNASRRQVAVVEKAERRAEEAARMESKRARREVAAATAVQASLRGRGARQQLQAARAAGEEAAVAQVRTTPSWPRSWANFSLL
jgi:hypothetical protein